MLDRSLEFRTNEVHEGVCTILELYETKIVDQLYVCRTADMRLGFRIYARLRFAHDMTHFVNRR